MAIIGAFSFFLTLPRSTYQELAASIEFAEYNAKMSSNPKMLLQTRHNARTRSVVRRLCGRRALQKERNSPKNNTEQ